MLFKPCSFLQNLMGSFKKADSSIPPGDSVRATAKELEVVSNPDSSEEDWLEVFEGLGYQSPNAGSPCQDSIPNDVSSPKPESNFKKFDRLALRAVPIIFLVGIGAYAAVTLQQHFIPKHQDTPWDHMVPLKERLGTSDPKVFQDKIKASWVPFKSASDGYTVVKFEVRSDGSFRNIQVESPDTTVHQQSACVNAVLASGPFFCPTERTDKFGSAKVYFDNGKITVETFHPRIYNGLDSIYSTDIEYDLPKEIEELHVNANEVESVGPN